MDHPDASVGLNVFTPTLSCSLLSDGFHLRKSDRVPTYTRDIPRGVKQGGQDVSQGEDLRLELRREEKKRLQKEEEGTMVQT